MTVRLVLPVLVRSIVLLAVFAGFAFVGVPGDDDGLGTGLVAFGVIMLVSAGWGAVDGVRRSLTEVLVVWPATAVVSALASVVISDLDAGLDVFLTDLLAVAPVVLALVLVPSLFAGVIMSAVRGRSSRA